MLKICLAFCKSEPQYAYKRYAYKENIQIMQKCTSSSGKADIKQPILIKRVQVLAFWRQMGFPDPTNTVLLSLKWLKHIQGISYNGMND